jgi:uncharacterized membrane protein required for colicin V production
MNLVDVLILGVVLLGALHGYRKGLITSIVNLASSIAGFLVAAWEYKPFLNWIEKFLPVQQWLEPAIYRALLPAVQSKTDALQKQALGNLLGALPQEWRDIFASANLTGVQFPQAVEQVTQKLAQMLTVNILELISFGVVFYIVVALIRLIAAMLLRPLGSWGGSFNRGGGLLLGGLTALIGLSILAGLFSPILQMGVSGGINTLIHNSYFYPYLLTVFHVFAQVFAAQLGQNLLGPQSLKKGVWF